MTFVDKQKVRHEDVVGVNGGLRRRTNKPQTPRFTSESHMCVVGFRHEKPLVTALVKV